MKDHDKLIINEIREASISDSNALAIGYFDLLAFTRSKAIAIQMCNTFKKGQLASALHSRM